MRRYQLTLHAERLRNEGGLFRVSSPYAEVEIIEGPNKGKIGKTEVAEKNLSPQWVKIFFIEFDPSIRVVIRVKIWDERGNGRDPIMIGKEVTFEATSVFTAPGHMHEEHMGGKGRLHIHIEESLKGSSTGHVQLHLRGLDMKNVEPGPFGLGRSDPFFEVSKKDSDPAIGHSRWNVVYRSEHINNNLNPYWQETAIGLEELCYGDLDWPLKITVLDYNSNGKHESIGELETSVNQLQERISIKGNADRDQAILLTRTGKLKTYGLVCVLKAKVVLNAIP